ncbi:polysaccharide deacetylase family protein [Knoellia remsis]|uniref:polysaccharide deacetylase family protein n=1 Tax=Knoellia remsis TaxID=407159 RepID=UPI001473496D|nr:polysaccharide deacetylase family protein [Knoellia remsis]
MATSLLLSGCSNDASRPSDTSSGTASASASSPRPSSSASRTSDETTGLTEVDPNLVTGFGTETFSAFRPQIHQVWPVLPEQQPLGDALRRGVEKRRAEFRDTYATPPPGGKAIAELNDTWSVTAASPQAIGVAMVSYVFSGAGGANALGTTWYDPRSGTVLDNLDLIDRDAQDAVESEVVRQLVQRGADESDVREAFRGDGPPLVGFNPAGSLVIGFDEYQVGPGSAGRLVATLDGDRLDGWLSDFGRAAREASLTPTQTGGSASSATPTPTPSASPSTAPTTPTPGTTGRTDCSTVKCVAITYDDGPGPHTAKLLDTLKRLDARATFFVLGQQVEAYPEVVKRARSEGHEVGNHSYDHKDLTRLSAQTMTKQWTSTNRAITSATGSAPTLGRPPYGAVNGAVKSAATENGLALVLWDVDTLDWKNRDSSKVAKTAVSQAKPGSIILMHDIHPTTVAAAEDVVTGLRKRGFTLVTVSDLLDDPKPGKTYSRR